VFQLADGDVGGFAAVNARKQQMAAYLHVVLARQRLHMGNELEFLKLLKGGDLLRQLHPLVNLEAKFVQRFRHEGSSFRTRSPWRPAGTAVQLLPYVYAAAPIP